MGRIRWGRLFTALLILLLFIYGGARLLNVPVPFVDTLIARAIPGAEGRATAVAQPPAQSTAPGNAPATAVPASAAPTRAAVTTAPTQPTATPAQRAPATPLPVQDTGFRSEVPIPESQGQFKLGYVTVAFDSQFPPYSPVVLLFQEKLAEKRGLGVHFVPFDIQDRNRISEQRRAELLQNGGFDVLLTTMNSYALWGGPDVGKVTAVIGESAGADKAVVQASAVQTFNDMDGKAFAYSDSSVSEYLLYYMLRVGGIPVSRVIRFGQENLDQAVRRYVNHEAHGVIGWTSSDMAAAEQRADSKVLMTSDQFRVTTDVVVTGTKALSTKRDAIQAFHDAWFEANRMVFEQPETAAQDMAKWSADWTGVANTKDLTDALKEFAQATLADNQQVMSDQNLPLLQSRYQEAQTVWASGGREVRRVLRPEDLAAVFDPAFVRKSAADTNLISNRPPVNPTFHLTAKSQVRGLTPEQQARLTTLAVLSVRQIQFDPGSSSLSAQAQQDIEEGVIPVLRNTVGTYLRIEGSAGWPAGAGLNEAAVNALAFERARAVQDYVIKFGIPVERLILATALPTCRECADPATVQSDNRVSFTLVSP